jgi:hypothetical protein
MKENERFMVMLGRELILTKSMLEKPEVIQRPALTVAITCLLMSHEGIPVVGECRVVLTQTLPSQAEVVHCPSFASEIASGSVLR